MKKFILLIGTVSLLVLGAVHGYGKSDFFPCPPSPVTGNPTDGYTLPGALSAGTSSQTTIGADGEITRAMPAANSDLVVAAPYDTPVAGSTWGNTSAITREFFEYAHKYRIRQNGTISKIRLMVGDLDLSPVTEFYITVWRYNGVTYDRVGISNNLASDLTRNTLDTITLTSPITGVQEGDFYGYRIVTTGTCAFLNARTGISGATNYRMDAAADSTGLAWLTKTAAQATVVPINLYMTAPQIVFAGDSITAGHPAHYTFCENPGVTDIHTKTDIDGSFPYFVASGVSVAGTPPTYQNMGIGGNTSTSLLARFQADVVDLKPRIAVINIGLNDLYGNISEETTIDNLRQMLDMCRANDIIPAIVKPTPWTAGSFADVATGDGAADGSTIVDTSGRSGTTAFYTNWWASVGGVTRQVICYDVGDISGTTQFFVSPSFPAQVTTGAVYKVSAMQERDERWEALADLVKSYPSAILLDADYAIGQRSTAGRPGNLWDIRTTPDYNSDNIHLETAGYKAMGAILAEQIKRIGSW